MYIKNIHNLDNEIMWHIYQHADFKIIIHDLQTALLRTSLGRMWQLKKCDFWDLKTNWCINYFYIYFLRIHSKILEKIFSGHFFTSQNLNTTLITFYLNFHNTHFLTLTKKNNYSFQSALWCLCSITNRLVQSKLETLSYTVGIPIWEFVRAAVGISTHTCATQKVKSNKPENKRLSTNKQKSTSK